MVSVKSNFGLLSLDNTNTIFVFLFLLVEFNKGKESIYSFFKDVSYQRSDNEVGDIRDLDSWVRSLWLNACYDVRFPLWGFFSSISLHFLQKKNVKRERSYELCKSDVVYTCHLSSDKKHKRTEISLSTLIAITQKAWIIIKTEQRLSSFLYFKEKREKAMYLVCQYFIVPYKSSSFSFSFRKREFKVFPEHISLMCFLTKEWPLEVNLRTMLYSRHPTRFISWWFIRGWFFV